MWVFAGARAAGQHDIPGAIEDLTTVQLAPRSISVASLISLAATPKPDRSLQAGKRAAVMWQAMERTSRSASSAFKS